LQYGEIIARIIAKMLALFEGTLEDWVNVTNVTQTENGDITWYLNISVLPSKELFISYLGDLVEATVRLMSVVIGVLGQD